MAYMIRDSSAAINDYPPTQVPSHTAVVITHATVLSHAANLSVLCGVVVWHDC